MKKKWKGLPESFINWIGDKPFVKDDIGLSCSSIYLFDHAILKIEDVSPESIREYETLTLLQGKLPVPKIILYHRDEKMSYLLMERIDGKMLCDDVFLNNPMLLVENLAHGLKTLWSVPIDDRMHDASVQSKLLHGKENIEKGEVDMDDWDTAFNTFENPEALYAFLYDHMPVEDRVFSHGDYCLPNILYDGNTLKGMIDLGRAGIGSKWMDISLAVRSLRYNLGSDDYTALFFEKLGVEKDDEKLLYYMLIDELY